MTSTHPRLWPIGLLALFGSSNPLLAQAITPGSDAPRGTKDEEAVVVLSPFEVSSATEAGTYAATSTLAGTRLNTALKDVPASISVMTADFLRDIGATNLNDAIEYGVGTEPDQSSANGINRQTSELVLNVRGFTGATISRNYFGVQQGASQDNYNIERVTFSRGPNSVLFGSGSPGGVVDSSTKQAQQRPLTAFANRIGPFDDYRFEADVDRPLTKHLAVRVNALVWNKHSWRDFDFSKRRSAALASTWTPFRNTKVRFELERGIVDEAKAQGWPAFDGVSSWIAAGRPISTFANPTATTPVLPGTTRLTVANKTFISNSGAVQSQLGTLRSSLPSTSAISSLAQFTTIFKNQDVVPFSANPYGPGLTTDHKFLQGAVFLEQRIGDKLFVELAISRQTTQRDWAKAILWNDGSVFADVSAFLPGGAPNPYVRQFYVESYRGGHDFYDLRANNYRLTSSYAFTIPHFGSHKLTGLASLSENGGPTWSTAEAWTNNPAQRDYTNAANRIYRRTYLSFSGPNPLGLSRGFDNPFNNPINTGGVQSGYYQSARADNLNRSGGIAAVLESRYFSGRLVAIVGARRDELKQWGSTITRDPVTQEVTGAVRNASAKTTAGNTATAGIVYHVIPQVSLAINKSSNNNPQAVYAFGPNSDNAAIPLGPKKGEGLDGSLRFHLFNGRVEGSFTYFKTSQVNAQTAIDGNATSGWLLFLNQGYIALGKPNASISPNYISGSDTTDQDAKGWETEWLLNVSRGFRLVANVSKSANVSANVFPRVIPFANEVIAELRAKPDLPVDGVSGGATAGALADKMAATIEKDLQAENLNQLNTRRYSANVFANYRFLEGRLKGVALNAGANIRGDRVIGYHSVTGAPWWAGAYVQYNASIGYDRSIQFAGKKIKWNVTLAGTNIFGHRYGLLPSVGNDLGVDRFFFETTPTAFLTNRLSF